MKTVIILLLLTSCATNRLTSNFKNEVEKICLSGVGKGRLHVGGHKYVFSYESALETEQEKWSLSMDFPMRNPELLEISWNEEGESKLNTSIDQKIMRENSDVNPEELDAFIKGLGDFVQDIIKIKEGMSRNKKVKWLMGKKKIKAQSGKVEGTFTNLKGKYFGKMSMDYSSKTSKTYKIDFIVRKCFEE